MIERDYYKVNGLSPLECMRNGLISSDEYRGFLLGSALKYLCRFQYKGSPVEDLVKCKSYIDELIVLMEKEKE